MRKQYPSITYCESITLMFLVHALPPKWYCLLRKLVVIRYSMLPQNKYSLAEPGRWEHHYLALKMQH